MAGRAVGAHRGGSTPFIGTERRRISKREGKGARDELDREKGRCLWFSKGGWASWRDGDGVARAGEDSRDEEMAAGLSCAARGVGWEVPRGGAAILGAGTTAAGQTDDRRRLGMAPTDAGAGLTKTRPQANPRGWKKSARR